MQDREGDESWRLYVLDLETDEATLVTPGAGVQARIVAHNRWHPDEVLVALNDRDPQLHDLHLLDLRDRSSSGSSLENPGFVDWLDRHRSAGAGRDDDGRRRRPRRPRRPGRRRTSRSSRSRRTTPSRPGSGASPATGSALLVLSSIGANATRLERHDLGSGERAVIAADPAYDVGGLWLDPATLEPQAVEFAKERQEIVLLDDVAARPTSTGSARSATATSASSRRERGDRLWVVSISPSDGPIRFWISGPCDGRGALPLPAPRGARGPAAGADGALLVHRPRRAHGARLPHLPARRWSGAGCPPSSTCTAGRGRATRWGFDAEAQWLANRGYVCVQVNFRASTGYGKAFLNAGDKQWGAAMQDDLADAVEHVGRAGLGRPRPGRHLRRLATAGTRCWRAPRSRPTCSAARVDIVGPSNLLTLLASIPEYWAAGHRA